MWSFLGVPIMPSALPQSLAFNVPFTPSGLAATGLLLLALSGVVYLANRA